MFACHSPGAHSPPRRLVLREAGLPDGVIAQRLGHSEAVMASVYGAPFAHQQDAAAMGSGEVARVTCETSVRRKGPPRWEVRGLCVSDLRKGGAAYRSRTDDLRITSASL
jgi:hypothetical protein